MQDRALKREAVWAPQCPGGRTWRLFRKDCGIRAEIDHISLLFAAYPLVAAQFWSKLVTVFGFGI